MDDASRGPSPQQPSRQPVEPLWRDIDGYLLARLPSRSRVPAVPADHADVGTTAEL